MKVSDLRGARLTWKRGHKLSAVGATMSHAHSGLDNHIEISNADYIVIQGADFQSSFYRVENIPISTHCNIKYRINQGVILET